MLIFAPNYRRYGKNILLYLVLICFGMQGYAKGKSEFMESKHTLGNVETLGRTNYEWLAERSNHESSKAAREVWSAFGIADRMGYSIVGGHPHCQLPLSQYPEVEAFVDKFLLGKKDIDTNVTKANVK